MLDGLPQLVSSVGVLEVSSKKLFDVLKPTSNARLIERLAASAFLILKDQQRALFTERLDDIQPEAEGLVVNRLVVFASVIDEHIQRPLGEEELMRGVIDLLPAEVPQIEPKLAAMLASKVLPMNLDRKSTRLNSSH